MTTLGELTRLADGGDPEAQISMAIVGFIRCGLGLCTFPEALDDAEVLLRQAVTSGTVDSTVSLASVLLTRSFEETDATRAMAYSEEADELLSSLAATADGRDCAVALLTECTFDERVPQPVRESASARRAELLEGLSAEEAGRVRENANRLLAAQAEEDAQLRLLVIQDIQQ